MGTPNRAETVAETLREVRLHGCTSPLDARWPDRTARAVLDALAAAGFMVIREADGCGCFVCPLPDRAAASLPTTNKEGQR